MKIDNEEFNAREALASTRLVRLCEKVMEFAKEKKNESAQQAFEILIGACGIYLAFVKEDLSSLEYAYSLLATVCFIYNQDYSKIADILNERTEI